MKTILAVSRYINDSRKDTYATNLGKMVDAVSIKVNSYDDGYVFSTDEYLIALINCVALEQRSTTNLLFGSYIPEQNFILVIRKNNS